MHMTSQRPLILVANNPFGHHLLTSQLLNLYRAMALETQVTLLCNGFMTDGGALHFPGLKVVDFSTRFGSPFTYLNLLIKLVLLRIRQPEAIYHLRGFVSGLLFYVSRFCRLRSNRYIYDPRGAFFIEWLELGKSKFLGRLFGWVEAQLICHSTATIVTSRKFARLYARLFGSNTTYLIIYNSTSFAFSKEKKEIPEDGTIRLVYLGTFNRWHEIDELFRVMSNAAQQIGSNRVEIHIFTPMRFHENVKSTFATIACRKLHVDYVSYQDIPERLSGMHVGVSVICPTLSTRIASPIKISDYIALGLVPLLNSGIGDFDEHFKSKKSAIIFPYQGDFDMSELSNVRTAPNMEIFDIVSQNSALRTLKPIISTLLKS